LHRENWNKSSCRTEVLLSCFSINHFHLSIYLYLRSGTFVPQQASHNLVSSNPHQVTKLKDWTNDTYSTIPAYHWLQMQPWVLPWTNRDLKAQPIKNLKDQTLILTWETIRQTKKLRICLFLNLRTDKLANSPSCIVQTKL